MSSKFATTHQQRLPKKRQTNTCSPTQTGVFHTTSEGREETSFQPHLCYSLKPEYSSWKLIFWDSQQQEFTIQNTFLPTQQLVVPLRAITANPQH